jgi:cytochrome b6
MEPEKPDKPTAHGETGVAVVDEAPKSFKENVSEELDLLKKKVEKDAVLAELEELKDPTKTQIYKSIFRFSYTWGMGGITFYLFIVLTFTGILLMYYYHPSKGQAFQDIIYLENDVPFGKLLRNMHRWAAHLMVITTWLHMLRVVMTGSYKTPREFNWSVGVVLLVLTLLLSFTGYLLPDDQLGFWAVTVGTNMARATPGLGHEGPFGPQLGMTPYNDVRFALLGGSIVDANALLRSYIWHCIAIPVIASVLMAVHFWRVRKDGGISGPAPVQLESEMKSPGARAVKQQVK